MNAKHDSHPDDGDLDLEEEIREREEAERAEQGRERGDAVASDDDLAAEPGEDEQRAAAGEGDTVASAGAGVPAPSIRSSFPWTRRRLINLGAAVVGGFLLVWISSVLLSREPAERRKRDNGIRADGRNALKISQRAPQWKMIKLGVAKKARSRYTDPIPGRVKFDARKASRVDSSLGGRVSRVYVELGQRVKRGAPLFAVTSPDIALLNSAIARAKVELSAAKAQLERVRAMVKARVLPEKDELEAERRNKAAQLSLSLARQRRAALKVHGHADNAFTVVSPQDGVVVHKDVLVGQEVSAGGKSLVEVADLTQLWVVADLPEGEATDVTIGSAARITSPAQRSAPVAGVVELVSEVVDPRRHTVPIRVRVSNEKARLRANMFVEVSFAVRPTPGAVEVPAPAVVSDGAEQYLYVQDGKRHFRKRRVVAGALRDGMVPIVKGVKPGETVVVRGAILLDNLLSLLN